MKKRTLILTALSIMALSLTACGFSFQANGNGGGEAVVINSEADDCEEPVSDEWEDVESDVDDVDDEKTVESFFATPEGQAMLDAEIESNREVLEANYSDWGMEFSGNNITYWYQVKEQIDGMNVVQVCQQLDESLSAEQIGSIAQGLITTCDVDWVMITYLYYNADGSVLFKKTVDELSDVLYVTDYRNEGEETDGTEEATLEDFYSDEAIKAVMEQELEYVMTNSNGVFSDIWYEVEGNTMTYCYQYAEPQDAEATAANIEAGITQEGVDALAANERQLTGVEHFTIVYVYYNSDGSLIYESEFDL